MSIDPVLTFKAGKCDWDSSVNPPKVKPIPTPGYIYLYYSDDLLHFCWRPRSAPASEPELDLIMIPGDGQFHPYLGQGQMGEDGSVESPTNGRIFTLRFSSSSQRHLFWLQSKSQHPNGKPNWFSKRDLKLGEIVDMLLAGEDVDIQHELNSINQSPHGDDDDETMEDVEGPDDTHNPPRGSGGAGPDATGGDIREEGEEAREGGADGARAASAGNQDASALVQDFLNSLQSGGTSSQRHQSKPFTTLSDLLSTSITIPVIESADNRLVDNLVSHLPPTILLLAQEVDDLTDVDPNSETVQAAIQALSQDQKRDILKRVLRSPQLHQSLGSLTVALRDGGLPTVSEALKIKVENGGFVRGGAVPLGGGEAVEAFLEGVKRTVQEEESGKMETD